MTSTLDSSIETVVALSNKMTKDYASAHGRAVYAGTEIDDGWDQLPDQISGATQQLNDVWSATRSHSEHRHIRAVEETIGELHDSLTRVSAATVNYLTVEAATKNQMDGGGQADMVGLEQARNKLEKADQALTTAKSNLVNNIGNLAMDS
jgi:hypothetical protein